MEKETERRESGSESNERDNILTGEVQKYINFRFAGNVSSFFGNDWLQIR
jgi:hypothetical protein